MSRKLFSPRFLLPFLFLLPFKTFCQEKKDTIYYDGDWSICEKPVAEYYRVCTLNKEKQIFYKGDVEDYFIDGNLEMKGHYANTGYKEGEFIFYNAKGNVIIKGKFSNNEMIGNWFFYNSISELIAEFNCKSAINFTPIFIVNSNKDTLVKNGNGKFVLNISADLPYIFYGKKNFIIEGEVENGLKNGVFNYYKAYPDKKFIFSETFKNGKPKNSAEAITATIGFRNINSPDFALSLSPSNLDRIDAFNHTNFVFEYNYDAESELINFLTKNETPFIKSRAINVKQNDDLLFDLIENVLYDSLMSFNNAKDIYYKRFKYPVKAYYSAAYSTNERNTFPKINADIILTIDTTGYIVNAAFSSNLTRQQINKISYYFTHVLNLAPYYVEGEKTMHNLNLKLDMLIDTLKNDSFHVSYLIYDADSVTETGLKKYIDTSTIFSEDYYKEFTSVQVEAKFPGGQDAWLKYLERNLNAQTPSDHRAPAGNYTVTVSFLVDEEGNVSDVHALNDPGYGTAEEAVRVIKNGPKWVPAIQNGKNVNYRQKQNITFQVVKF